MNLFPDLPFYISGKVQHLGYWHFEDQEVLARLPCAVFLNAIGNSTFIDGLPPNVLKSMSKSTDFWRCLGIENVRDLMKSANFGYKLQISDGLEAAEVLASVHGLDMEVIFSLHFIKQNPFKKQESFYKSRSKCNLVFF